MAMHLRSDQYFVEDEHWNEAAGRYAAFLKEHGKEKTLLLELGVGFNTPAIIRFPFEKMVKENGGWSLVRMNLREAIVPESLGKRAVGINDDISRSIEDIRKEAEKDGGRNRKSGWIIFFMNSRKIPADTEIWRQERITERRECFCVLL